MFSIKANTLGIMDMHLERGHANVEGISVLKPTASGNHKELASVHGKFYHADKTLANIHFIGDMSVANAVSITLSSPLVLGGNALTNEGGTAWLGLAPVANVETSTAGLVTLGSNLYSNNLSVGTSVAPTGNALASMIQSRVASNHVHDASAFTSGTLSGNILPKASSSARGIANLNSNLMTHYYVGPGFYDNQTYYYIPFPSYANNNTAVSVGVLNAINWKFTDHSTALSGKAAASHTHDASAITSGVCSAAALPTASTTATGAVQLGSYFPETSPNSSSHASAADYINYARHSGSTTDFIPTSRTVTAGDGLSGGGSLAADRTIDMDNVLTGLRSVYRTTTGNNVVFRARSDNYGTDTACATVEADGDYNNLSDERLKTDIVTDATDHLSKVLQLRIREFNWNCLPDTERTRGVIAQEVRQVYGDEPYIEGLVVEDEEGCPPACADPNDTCPCLHLCVSNLVFPAIRAIQQLSSQVDALQAEVDALQ